MEIYLDRRAIRRIKLSAQEAIEEGDTEALREDLYEAFAEEQVEEIERHLDAGDLFEFLTDILDEWSGDEVEELFELLETQLSEVGIDLKTEDEEKDEEDDEEEDPDPDEDDEMVGIGLDDDLDDVLDD